MPQIDCQPWLKCGTCLHMWCSRDAGGRVCNPQGAAARGPPAAVALAGRLHAGHGALGRIHQGAQITPQALAAVTLPHEDKYD